LIVQSIEIEQQAIYHIEEIRIRITRETTITIEMIELENIRILAEITLTLQLEFEIEIERITIYYTGLYRMEEERQNVLYTQLVYDLEAYYSIQINALNNHYLQIIVDLEAEWNLTISIEIERITRVSHDILIQF
jgi:hypothetical protein